MWKIKKIDKDIFICPNCGAEVEQRTPFCPYCGKNNRVVEMNLFDTSEVHHNCTVEIWKNSATGEVSIGWYKNE